MNDIIRNSGQQTSLKVAILRKLNSIVDARPPIDTKSIEMTVLGLTVDGFWVTFGSLNCGWPLGSPMGNPAQVLEMPRIT